MLGASFGWGWGWLSAQLALAFQLALLVHVGADRPRPRLVAAAGACFAAGMAIAGYAGFATGLSAEYLRAASLTGAIVLAAHAALGAACAWGAARLSGASLLRWALTWPALWCAQEWVMGQGEWALPWLRLGNLQAAPGPLAGWLPLGGSLLAGLAMGWLAAAMVALAQRGPKRPAAMALLLLLLISAAGRHDWTERSGDIRAVLLPTSATTDGSLSSYLAEAQRQPDSLLVAAQLAIPKTPQALSAAYLAELQQQLKASHSDLLVGLYLDAGEHQFFNGVMALGSGGSQSYGKRQLFPMGEFQPWGGALREWAEPGGTQRQDMARASGHAEPLWLNGHRVSVNICYELAFPALWRQEAAASELIVSVSSDSSHANAALARQTEQAAQARALEFQKPVLRSTDVGTGYAVEADGHLLRPAFSLDEAPPALALETRRGLTPFAVLGDALALSLSALCAFAAGLAWRGRVESHYTPRRLTLARQSGQILMAAVALLLVSAAMLYFMVNSGQVVTEKMRVTNAADAGAYSAGVVQARVLNYDAYLNRAMVANEIAIAQMVSFGSWLRYFGTAVDYVPATAGEIALMLEPGLEATKIVAIFAATDYVLEEFTGTSATEYATYILDYAIGPIIAVHDAVVVAMSYAQEAAHLNLVAGLRQGQIANDVAKEMDPTLKAQVVLTSYGFDFFTKSYAKSGETGDERGRFADVTMRSRDAFTRERNWTIGSIDIPLIRRDGALKKRGGTDLVGYDEWRGIDTLELHGSSFGCGKFHLSWCDDIQVPVGWGAVNVNTGDGDAGHGYHGNAYGENGNTASIADGDMQEPGYTSFHGIPDAREIKNLDPKADISTGITILVSKQHSDLRTSGGSASAKPSGELALFSDKPAGAKMIALSRAQVYFDRIARRADGRTEIGSLYNPYWRVRLVAPTGTDRAYAAAMQGGMILPDLP